MVPSAGRSPGRDLSADERLTQAGKQMADRSFVFGNSLKDWRDPPERSMSLILGDHGPHEAIYHAFHRPPANRDASRTTTVGKLVDVGFRVEHTPFLPVTPLHVSVWWDDGEWDDQVAALFDGCFDEPRGGHDG